MAPDDNTQTDREWLDRLLGIGRMRTMEDQHARWRKTLKQRGDATLQMELLSVTNSGLLSRLSPAGRDTLEAREHQLRALMQERQVNE